MTNHPETPTPLMAHILEWATDEDLDAITEALHAVAQLGPVATNIVAAYHMDEESPEARPSDVNGTREQKDAVKAVETLLDLLLPVALLVDREITNRSTP